jgi:triacylglycerol lipase
MIEVLKNKVGTYKFKGAQNESKGTIVFIHGFATNSDYHDEMAERFDRYDYYAFELPGHGYTKFEKNSKIDLVVFTDYCIAMIEELELKNIILLGHSMGGSIAMRVTNIIKEKIQKLILVTPMNSSITPYSLKMFFMFTPKSFNKTLALNNVLYKDLTKTINLNIEHYINKEHEYQVSHIDFFRKLK